MNYSNIAVMCAKKLEIHQKNKYIMSKILSKIGQKKELLERKIGGKKQNRLSPNYGCNFLSAHRNLPTSGLLYVPFYGVTYN